MEIAGHVSRQMLSRYSHIRMQAKRNALEEIDRQRNRSSPEACASHTTVRASAAETRDIVN
jgi:hypothetical protein